MMRCFARVVVVGGVLATSFVLWAQAPQKTLTISGMSGQAPVVQMNGRSYVELEDLARLTLGTLQFKTDQIVLSLSAPLPTVVPKPKQGFSPAFLSAGIEQMSAIREWRIGIVNAIQNNYVLSEDWLGVQRRLADKNLNVAQIAASTEDDKSGLALLEGEFNNMQALNDWYLSMRSRNLYMSTDALENDTPDQKILTCARAMAAMASANKFQDEISCH